LPTARLEVAEACSGIRSLFSLITLTVIYGYLAETKTGVRVRWPDRGSSFNSANALRIAITGVVVQHWGLEGAQGTPASVSGWLIFASSLLRFFPFIVCRGYFFSASRLP
jgi:exosortase/archaeosortase family protein